MKNIKLSKKIKLCFGIIFKRALTGPLKVQIDLSNNCNLNCVHCWHNNPRNHPKNWYQENIESKIFYRLVDDLKKLSIQEIHLVGAGEPFMHPHIMNFIRYVKQKGIYCLVRTNGTLINKKNIKEFIDTGLDAIDLHISAGSRKRYEEIHPGNGKRFDQITSWLQYLMKEKYKNPSVEFLNVISTVNYQYVSEMIDFAKDYKVDCSFIPAFEFDDKKNLVLSKQQLEDLRFEYPKYFVKNEYTKFPCYIGYIYARILVDGSVVHCCAADFDKPMGNLYDSGFKKIWKSAKYNEFRKLSFSNKLSSLYCKHECPHTSENRQLQQKLSLITSK
jgi:MoaA/NifB/PqqE/SkfB family radical SAM enzyme